MSPVREQSVEGNIWELRNRK